MRSLIFKDLALLRSSRLFFIGLLYSLFIIFDRGGSDSALGTSTFFLVFISYIFVNYLNSYDYMNHGDRFVNAFPVSRKQVVEGRYGSVMILVICFLVLSYGLRTLLWILGYPYATGVVNIPQFTVVIFAVCLYYGIMLPLYFKLGYEKLRWINLISLIIVSVASTVISALIGSFPLFSKWWMPILGIFVGWIVLRISLQRAVKYYESRDF